MKPNQYPHQPNQNQPQGAEQAPAPLNPEETAALNERLRQRLRQADADPTGAHALKPGEILPAGYQDMYGKNQQVTAQFLGFDMNERAEKVPVFHRYVEPPAPQPQPSQQPYGNQYPPRPAAPQPQPPRTSPTQNQYPPQPYQGHGQYPQPQRPPVPGNQYPGPQQQYPQPPVYPGQQAPRPVAPPRNERQDGQPTQAYNVAAPWLEVTPDQVPEGVRFGPEQTEEKTVGFGPRYQSYFGQRGVEIGELDNTGTHVEAVGPVIGERGPAGDDRFVTSELRQDDLEAARARVAAEEEAARRAMQQQPPQDHGQQQ